MLANVAETDTLRVSRLIKAPRERVFAAWTTPADILKWFGPETCRALSANLDVRVGGEYHFHLKTEPFGEIDLNGVYREVIRPAKLVYTWNWKGHPELEFGETLVTVEFLDRNGNTEVQLTHDGPPSAEIRNDHQHGWNGCFDKLEKQMASETAASASGGPRKMNRVVWFDVPVTDLERAARFYSTVLGEPVHREEMHGFKFAVLPHQGDEVSGCLTPACEGNDNKPSANGPLLYFNCQGRLDEALAAVEPNGGKIQKPKHPIGPYGFRAVVLDSEGNRIALHSM